MLTSVNWMNEYLDPPASAREQAQLLTRAGFPLEASEALNGSDTRQDYEMTSNRGGCVCHIGLAREIAAISGRTLNSSAHIGSRAESGKVSSISPLGIAATTCP